MALAGVLLGASVLTRLPNILECGLIVAVFYYGIVKKKPAKEIWKDVGACAAGFAAAFGAGFLCICLQFGPGAYGEMLTGLSGYQSTDATYSPLSMLSSVLGAYVTSFKWVLLLAAVAAGAVRKGENGAVSVHASGAFAAFVGQRYVQFPVRLLLERVSVVHGIAVCGHRAVHPGAGKPKNFPEG